MTPREKNKLIKRLDEVVKHLVDEADRGELSNREFAELNRYLHAAIRGLEGACTHWCQEMRGYLG